MNSRESSSQFPESVWSLIERVAESDGAVAHEALEELVGRYYFPLHSHLRMRWPLDDNDASDLLQEFVSAKILEYGLIKRADRKRGKFRTFLLTALDRFVIDSFRKAKRLPVHLDVDDADAVAKERLLFDQVWAQAIIVQALRQIREECRRKNQETIWKILHRCLLSPLVDGQKPPPHAQLAREYGLKNAKQVGDRLTTVTRKLRHQLRGIVAEYTDGEESIQEELFELKRVLADATRGPSSFDADSSIMNSELWSTVSNADSASLSNLIAIGSDPPNDQLGCGDLLDLELSRTVIELMRRFSHEVNLPKAPKDPSLFGAMTVGELLSHSDPGLDLLDTVRRIYRHRSHVETDSIREVDRVIYVTAHAAALVNYQKYLSKSAPKEMLNSWKSALRRDWLEPSIGTLLQAAIDQGVDGVE